MLKECMPNWKKILKNGDYFDRISAKIGLCPESTWDSEMCHRLLAASKPREVIKEYYRMQNLPHYRDDRTEVWCRALEDFTIELLLLRSETK